MHNFYLKISTVFILAFSLLACDSQAPRTSYITKVIHVQQASNVWDRMADNFEIKNHHTNPRVQRFIKQFTRNDAQNLIQFSKQAAPYLYHVVTTAEELGMPSDLALLPIVESEYRPFAISNRGAAGIWQIASMTGRLYGLKQDQWYDGRKDIDAATRAAFEHLKFLAEKFDNDWLLALAAYNCGGGRVSQAIRKNKQLGKPTDYWSLSLPKETMHFVPKFLAIAYLVKHRQQHGIELAPIANQPYFTKVKLDSQISLHTAAELANLDLKEVKSLNPAYRNHVTHPNGPHQILLPIKHASIFRANFNATKSPKPTMKTPSKPKAKTQPKIKPPTTINPDVIATTYTVSKGDTLAIIAVKHSTTVQEIKHKNNLKSDIIRRGQVLAI
jgi:membrane-bound lytic murein transglycosylase D